ncbi:hypothetical protein FVE85_2572 [Porphyridium purpureum]|uniref:START domain-containing protein n=1 Tax=Porphyridium purpureum TaxID=35688 RepID=A0A5J4YMD4_PORPP|nr:hypothetical protein FVE85_2572 [Porphyridium purpureum]|eukprot:POR6437..scf291_13
MDKTTFEAQVPSRVSAIVSLFHAEKHFQAARSLLALTEEAGVLNAQGAVDTECARYVEIPLIRQIESEVLKTLELLRSEEGWQISYEGNNTKVWYRQSANSSLNTFKVEGTLLAPVVNVAALLNEIDLFGELFWFMRQTKETERVSRTRTAFSIATSLFWPLSDRFANVLGYAVDGLDEDECMMIVCRDMDYDVDVNAKGQKFAKVPVPKGAVPMRAELIGWQFVPIEPTLTTVRLVAHVDLNLSFVPSAFVNWASKAFARHTIATLDHQAKQLPPAHQQRLVDPERRQVYDWIDGQLRSYWEKKGKADVYDGGELHNDPGRKLSDVGNATGPDKKLVMQMMKGGK